MDRKYLILRKDGSIPTWPAFVLAGADPAAPVALRAYADEAERLNMPSKYVREVRALADTYDAYQQDHAPGNPGEADQRGRCEFVNRLMSVGIAR